MFLCPQGTVWRTRSMLFSFDSIASFLRTPLFIAPRAACSLQRTFHQRFSLGALFNAFRQCLVAYRVQMIKTNNLPSHSWWHKNDLSEPNAFKEHESHNCQIHIRCFVPMKMMWSHISCVCVNFCIAEIHRTPHTVEHYQEQRRRGRAQWCKYEMNTSFADGPARCAVTIFETHFVFSIIFARRRRRSLLRIVRNVCEIAYEIHKRTFLLFSFPLFLSFARSVTLRMKWHLFREN